MLGDKQKSNTKVEHVRRVYHKERSRLIVVSIVVLFIESSQIKLEKINLLGNSFKIENPNVVTLWMWLVFVYFLLMYTYYFNIVEKDEEFLYAKELYKKLLYKHYVNEEFISKLSEIHKRYFSKAYEDWIYLDAKIEKKSIKLKFERHVITDDSSMYTESIFPPDLEIGINNIVKFFCKIKSISIASIRTKLFFESYLPFVLSLIAIFYKIIILVIQ